MSPSTQKAQEICQNFDKEQPADLQCLMRANEKIVTTEFTCKIDDSGNMKTIPMTFCSEELKSHNVTLDENMMKQSRTIQDPKKCSTILNRSVCGIPQLNWDVKKAELDVNDNNADRPVLCMPVDHPCKSNGDCCSNKCELLQGVANFRTCKA